MLNPLGLHEKRAQIIIRFSGKLILIDIHACTSCCVLRMYKVSKDTGPNSDKR